MTALTEDARKLIARCGRGGKYQYYWTDMGDLTRWFEVGKPAKLGKRDLKGNLYFGVHPTHTNRKGYHKVRARIGDIAAVNCLFADVDAKDFGGDKAKILAYLDTLEIYPSVIVDSGGGFHCYWFLPEPVLVTDENREHVRAVQLCWVDLLGADQGAKGLNHPLRIPGTLNHKDDYAPDFPTVTVVRADWDRTVPFCRFEKLTAKLRNKRQQRTEYTQPTTPIDVDDQTLLEEAFSNPTNGVSIRALWNGDISAYASQSSADLALCCHLAYYTGRDKARMDVLFRQSGLYREKWERNDYRDSTLDGANEMTTNVWTPRVYTNGTGPNEEYTDPPLDMCDPEIIADIIKKYGKPAQRRHSSYPYGVEGNTLVRHFENKDGEMDTTTIADFWGRVVKEFTDEGGGRHFVIQGIAKRGGPFTVEVEASIFGSDTRLRGKLEAAAGAMDSVRPDMAKHLGSAIKLLTQDEELQRITRYHRTGWTDNHQTFLVGGREPKNTQIQLPGKLSFHVTAPEDATDAIDTLKRLIESVDASNSTPVLAMLLQAPMHRVAGWQNERYGMFIQGRTGSLKTSFVQTAMCIYGTAFFDSDNLIKWGEGATRNALMSYATTATDMPLFIDNFKPNTGNGEAGLINLIHNILEGGDKDRLNRNSELKETKSIHCFPIITGEDSPSTDSATLARLLEVKFAWQKGQANDDLSSAQDNHLKLEGVGDLWIDWIECDEGRVVIAEKAKKLHEHRAVWAETLRKARPDMANILRVATNLAVNELTWEIAQQHPRLGALFTEYANEHKAGLHNIAANMANATTAALEAHRFLATLRELIAGGRYTLIDLHSSADANEKFAKRMLGWHDSSGVYLLPQMALGAVKEALGPANFVASAQALYGQLDSLGYIADRGKERTTKLLKVNDKPHRVLHLKADALDAEGDSESETGDIVEELGL